MPIKLANGKKSKLLDLQRTYLSGLRYKLYVNNLDPTEASVVAAFTECTDGGYAQLVNPVFGAPGLNGANQAQTVAPPWTVTFTHNGGNFTVYGYYAIDPADGLLVFSERAPTPFTCTAAGQTFTVTPTFALTTLP